MNETNIDILITRVIDKRAGAADWAELESLAAADTSVWRELAMAQKDAIALSAGVEAKIASAAAVELPATIVMPHSEAGVKRRMRNVAAWGGWATAAALVLAVIANRPMAGPGTGEQVAGVSLPSMLSKYLDQGKKEGTVIGELPDRVILNSNQLPDGQTEVVFVRQIVERVKVNDLYRMSTNEAGDLSPVKVRPKMMLSSNGPT